MTAALAKISLQRTASRLVAKRGFAAASEDLVKTALNDLHKGKARSARYNEKGVTLPTIFTHICHVELGGNMVPFAGYELPVFYGGENGGVMKEHLWCRSEGKASLFDVSHMGQIRWHGKDRVAFLEKIVVSDIGGLAEGSGCLSLVTNEKGGIIDDTVITNAGDYIYMVVNGACKYGDMEHFQEQMSAFGGDVSMEYLGDDMQLLAIQGPGAAAAVKKILPSDFDLVKMAFMTGVDTTLDGVDGCRITR